MAAWASSVLLGSALAFGRAARTPAVLLMLLVASPGSQAAEQVRSMWPE